MWTNYDDQLKRDEGWVCGAAPFRGMNKIPNKGGELHFENDAETEDGDACEEEGSISY